MGASSNDLRKLLARGYSIQGKSAQNGISISGPDGRQMRAPDGRIVRIDPRKLSAKGMAHLLESYGVPLR
jgi:hypothetical protein